MMPTPSPTLTLTGLERAEHVLGQPTRPVSGVAA